MKSDCGPSPMKRQKPRSKKDTATSKKESDQLKAGYVKPMGSLAPDNSPAPDSGEPVSRNHTRFIKVKCQIQSVDYEIDE